MLPNDRRSSYWLGVGYRVGAIARPICFLLVAYQSDAPNLVALKLYCNPTAATDTLIRAREVAGNFKACFAFWVRTIYLLSLCHLLLNCSTGIHPILIPISGQTR